MDFSELREKVIKLNNNKAILIEKQNRLSDVNKEAQDLRKVFSKEGVQERLISLNSERDFTKDLISEIKKNIRNDDNFIKEFIENVGSEDISQEYGEILSIYYGQNIIFILTENGSTFDKNTSEIVKLIATKNKKLHGKVLSLVKPGLIENDIVKEKSQVEVCYYTKKVSAGMEVVINDKTIKKI